MPSITKVKKIRIKRTITLEHVAEQLAQDIIGAVYSAIGNKTVYDLREGELTEVVDQALDRIGMSDDLVRINKTRIEINVALDVSGSMFKRFEKYALVKPIVPALTTMRVLLRALKIVSDTLPSDVFKYSLWLWAMTWGGEFACLSHPNQDDGRLSHLLGERDFKAVDDLLLSLSKEKPSWRGSATYLAPLLTNFEKWNAELGDPTAHKLDIILTDGGLYDVEESSVVQEFRVTNKYEAILLMLGNAVTRVPRGFTQFSIRPTEVGEVIRNFLLGFVQRL